MNQETPKPIPVNEPVLSDVSKQNVNEAINSGWISSAGKFVTEFEESFAHYLGVKHAVAVCNGTAALHVALSALGVGQGDEVIVPAFTMAASWLAVLYTGAKPVFVDCEPDTFNIDPDLVEARINSKTKAIMPVHIYGHPVDMTPILKLAKKHSLFVLEDAAEAHGAEYKGKRCGSFGQINCFSFYANKIITMGEGGVVVTDDDSLAKKARKIKDLYHSDQKRFIHEHVGYNYRLTNLQAALGCGELSHIEEYLLKKRYMAQLYNLLLRQVPGVSLPVCKPYANCVYWMYGILVDDSKFGLSKDELRVRLKEKGIDTRDFFYPPSQQPVLTSLLSKKDHFPNAEAVAKAGLYLPSGLAITEAQVKFVAKTIVEIQRLATSA